MDDLQLKLPDPKKSPHLSLERFTESKNCLKKKRQIRVVKKWWSFKLQHQFYDYIIYIYIYIYACLLDIVDTFNNGKCVQLILFQLKCRAKKTRKVSGCAGFPTKALIQVKDAVPVFPR